MVVKIIIDFVRLGLIALGVAAIFDGQFSTLMPIAGWIVGGFIVLSFLVSMLYFILKK